jgi:imidazolonepropionase-like amidohydrolase
MVNHDDPSLILRGGQLWDGVAAGTTNGELAIVDGTIAAAAPSDARVIDVAGATVVPGLIEGHGHLCFNAAPDWRAVFDGASEASMLLRMSTAARTVLAAGITTFRDLGSPTALSTSLRDAIAGGVVPGANLIVAGAPVTTTKGHCWFIGGEADGEAGVRTAVRERAEAGVDWIKVMASGGNMTENSDTLVAQYTAEEIAAIVEEAHALGLRVAAHCHGTEGVRVAVMGGVDTLEHCSFQNEDGFYGDAELIDEIAERGIIISPTVYGSTLNARGTEGWESRVKLFGMMIDAGCRMLMSTDCGIPSTPHDSLPRSMEAFQLLTDLPPVEVLKMATSTSAELLGLADRGTLDVGRRGDLLVVDGDPTVDIAALQRARLVVQAGEVVFEAPRD